MKLANSRLVALGATASLLTIGAATATTAHAATPAQAHDTMVLSHDVLAHPSTYADLGRTDPDTPVEIDVTIQRPHVAREIAAYHAMYTKGSGSYHHFLTVGQFDKRFGVPKAQYDAVRDYATSDGLHVIGHPGSNDIVRLAGNAKQAEDTFDVTLRDYRVTDPKKSADPQAKKGLVFHANTTGPTVPKGLDIQGVIGLNSLLRMHRPHSRTNPMPNGAPHGKVPAPSPSPATAHNGPAQTSCGVASALPLPSGVPDPTGSICIGSTSPQDLWAAYDQPGGYKADPRGNLKVDFGQGQQMAVFGEGQTDDVVSNLRIFEKTRKLPRMPITVVRTDGKNADYSDDAGAIEWELDTQSSTGMSPDALREVLYFGKDLTDADVLGVFSTWADDPDGPMQANASYGECEENGLGDVAGKAHIPTYPTTPYAGSSGAMYTLKSEAILRKATMLGKTLFSSSGDTGSSCPVVVVPVAGAGNGVLNQGFPVISYPASSPYAVSVGGTVLYTNKSDHKRALEYAWTFGGGGSSQVFAKPAYQDGISNIKGACLWAPGGSAKDVAANLGKPCEGAPDVAAQSGDVATNGYGIVAEGETNFNEGGTSLSSPLWMGMWTRIQAANPATRSCSGKVSLPRTLGYANPVLYQAFKGKHGSRDFYDIGNLQESPPSPPLGNGLFTAMPGWDYVSGMGTPDVNNLILDITGVAKPAPPARAVLPKQAAAASSKPRPNDCTPLFTDQKGDDNYPAGTMMGNNKQLDILAGNIDYVTKNADGDSGKFLKTVMVINDLSKDMASPAGGGNEYYFLWSYKGTQYFSDAEVDSATQQVTFHDGTVDGTTYSNNNTDTGEFNVGTGGTADSGKKGTVVVYVPLKDVGSPSTGATLTAPGAQTKVLVGTAEAGGLIEVADGTTAHYTYTVGDSCTSDDAGIAPGPYKTKGNAPPYKTVYGNYKKQEPSAGPTPTIAKSGKTHVVNGCHPHHGGNGPPAGNGEGTPPGNGNGAGNGHGNAAGNGHGSGGGSASGGGGRVTNASPTRGQLAFTGLDGALPIAAAVLIVLGLGGLAWWRRRASG